MDVLQIPAAKSSQSAFQRLQRQLFHRAIHRLEKAQRSLRIVFAEVLEVAKGVQFGVVANEDFNWVQAATAAKWPGLYFLKGLRREWRKAASSCGS